MRLIQFTTQLFYQVVPGDLIATASKLSECLTHIECIIPHQVTLHFVLSWRWLQDVLPSLCIQFSCHVIEALVVTELALQIFRLFRGKFSEDFLWFWYENLTKLWVFKHIVHYEIDSSHITLSLVDAHIVNQCFGKISSWDLHSACLSSNLKASTVFKSSLSRTNLWRKSSSCTSFLAIKLNSY